MTNSFWLLCWFNYAAPPGSCHCLYFSYFKHFCGTLDRITVIDWFPRSFFGLFCALCAYIRICLAAAYVCYTRTPDVILCDQVSIYFILMFYEELLIIGF